MSIVKVILLLLLISATFVDARARRKRRQLSSASYYISDVNPYSSSYSPTAPLTYPSGSFYSAPNYGYSNTGYNVDQPYYSNYNGPDTSQFSPVYPSNYDTQYPYGAMQPYAYPNLGSAYGSGLYGGYGSLAYGYAPTGFNNRFANWHQGNINEYYTGGTGSGLVDTGDYWKRGLRIFPYRGRPGGNRNGGNPSELNPPVPSQHSATGNSQYQAKRIK